VSELVQIEVGDVDLERSKIFIRRGKGQKDVNPRRIPSGYHTPTSATAA
jgi:integrase